MYGKIITGAAIAAVLAAIILARGWMREHDALVLANERIVGLELGASANDAGISELDSHASEREIRYVEVVRTVTAAGPLSANCLMDPAWVAAGRGTLSLRRAYCTDHPERCTVAVMPDPVDGAP